MSFARSDHFAVAVLLLHCGPVMIPVAGYGSGSFTIKPVLVQLRTCKALALIARADCGCEMATTVASFLSAKLSEVWMRWTQLLCVIGVSLWSAVFVGSQATDGGPLSTALRAHLQAERFEIVTSIRGLPLGVRDRLQMLFGSHTLDIADPGAEFQGTNVVANPKLPTRRLIAAGCSNDYHCLVYYERGGTEHTWHVALFHWTPAATRFEWGSPAPRGLAKIDEVRNAILSGEIKGQARFW